MKIDREVKILLRKELRMLFASRSATLTGCLLPLILLGFVPGALTAAILSEPIQRAGEGSSDGPTLGLFGEMAEDPRRLPVIILPQLVAIVGILVPTIMASHLLIIERERRTLELLVALPVRITQVMVAKLVAVLLVSLAITLPLLAIHSVVLPLTGLARVEDVIALPLLLAAALALSTSTSLLLALLAKDFRTANNVAGAILGPCIVGTMVIGALLPGGVVRPLVLAAVAALAAVIVFRTALKKITFERLMS